MISNPFFIPFKQSIKGISIPKRFTYPFNYQPHPLSLIAAKQLQKHIQTQTDWKHNFGDTNYKKGKPLGKMFGVLVVETPQKKLGYLAAFSGILAGKTNLKGFVPPIYDRKSETSFYTTKEEEINGINRKIDELKNSQEYINASVSLQTETQNSMDTLAAKKAVLKAAKRNRDQIRKNTVNLESKELEEILKALRQESMDMDLEYKKLTKNWRIVLGKLQDHVNRLEAEIDVLKQERKRKSAEMQQHLFGKYQFLNIRKQEKNVLDIFETTVLKKPPAGAGDCAAPKLLQYAFQHNLKPIAMAEFWWGQSPKQEIRKQGYFYPACKSKCEPILRHMLDGLKLDKNPIESAPPKKLKITTLFEDEHLIIINKPSGLLSIPGKRIKDSVFSRISDKYPDATGPILAHRLDMSTSGVMILSKSLEIHKILQRQFTTRTVKKRYVALLDGLLKENKGEIDLPLRVDLDNRPSQMVCFEHGKPAHTHWEVIERKGNQTRVHFFPVTGRTHQLRVHAAHPSGLNAPIVGDDIYGIKSNRLHLHAEYIEFTHPVSNERVSFMVEAEF